MSKGATYPWLFSARVDLGVFLGPTLVSLALLAVGASLGVLHSDSPEWIWVPTVLLIDVAHVWSTLFRVYLDSEERRRRALLYWGLPVLAYVAGVLLYSLGALWFWRVAAYLAVYHFMRQQYGWVAMYRRRAHEIGEFDRLLDKITIYSVTLYPLLYWHAHLPQKYWWFMPHDFVAVLPLVVATAAAPLYWSIVAVYLLRAVYRYRVLGLRNPGKDIVVVTTALCWYLGIVTFNSDYAFTVTNVLIHGVPYMTLVYVMGRKRMEAGHGGGIGLLAYGPLAFLAVLVLLAYGEELLWDQWIWHDRPWLFGTGWSWGQAAQTFLVPLLALPQITHYLLDGFIWRTRSNPDFVQTTASTGTRQR